MPLNKIKNCMRDFNSQAEEYFECKSESIENLLNLNLSLLNECSDLPLETDINEFTKFFLNLQKLISHLNPNSTSFWLCISFLEKIVKNPEIRNVILYKYKFLEILIHHLDYIKNLEKRLKFLTLLEHLTYGIEIKSNESHLIILVKLLINNVISNDDKQIIMLSLSILVNISSSKAGGIIFIRCLGNSSTVFTQKIRSYGILGFKLIIILRHGVPQLKTEDFTNFIQLSFKEINTAIITLDISLVNNIIDFFNRFISASHINKINLNNDVENLLKNLSDRMSMEDKMEIDTINDELANFISVIFKFLTIINFDSSLESLYPALIEFGNKWILNEITMINVLRLFTNISRKLIYTETGKGLLKDIVQHIPTMVSSVLEMKKNDHDIIISLLEIVSILIKNPDIQHAIQNCANESFFNRILSKVLEINVEAINFEKFSNKEIEMFIICIDTMYEFSNVVPLYWSSIISNYFKLKQIHFIFARGMLCGNKDICNIVFKLSKVHNYNAEVSKIIATQGLLIAAQAFLPSKRIKNSFNYELELDFCRNRTQENELESLFEHITNSMKVGGVQNILKTDIIEVFQQKIDRYNKVEEFLKSKIKFLENEIEHQTDLISLLSNEVSSSLSSNYSLNFSQERLQKEHILLETELNNAATAIVALRESINKEANNSKIHEHNLKTKIKKIEILTQETNNAKLEILNLEKAIKEKDLLLEELKTEKDNIEVKNKALLNLMQEERTDKNNKIKALEAQTKNLDLEVKNLEQQRQLVLQLMQNK